MINPKIYYTYNDISLVPSELSKIKHRKDCNPYHEDGKLPIFTAPMSTVVNEENFQLFEENHINAILPRNIDIGIRIKYSLEGKWAAFSLKEFEDLFTTKNETYDKDCQIKALIDVANGHMCKLYELVSESKRVYGSRIQVMIGNIANPNTYYDAYRAGADYIRVGIGSGCGCITSSNTSIHMPMASLVDETYEVKRHLIQDEFVDPNKLPKIIADGGVRNYNDIIKALALGADYVMIGSVLAKTFESAGEMVAYVQHAFKDGDYIQVNVTKDDVTYNPSLKKYFYDGVEVNRLVKRFYGMASAEGQKDLFGKKVKTSEGIAKELDVEYCLSGWVENFTDFLRSAMSYTDSQTLDELKLAHKIVISNNAYNAINR